MALFYRVRTVHSGLAGSPYLSTFNFAVDSGLDPNTAADWVNDFWDGIKGFMASGNTATTAGEVEVVEETTGFIQETLPITTFSVAGTSGGAPEWTAKQGNLRLRTGTYTEGRRVQGRLYIPGVPSGLGEQTPASNYVSQVNVAANTLRIAASNGGNDWSVFSRPRQTPARAGSISSITSAGIRPQWAVLRSRRD